MQKFSPRYVLWLFFSGVGWSLNVCYVHLHNWDNFHIRGMLRFYSPLGSSGGIYCNLRSSTGFAFNFRRLKCGTNRSSGQQFFPCKQTLFDTTKNVCEKSGASTIWMKGAWWQPGMSIGHWRKLNTLIERIPMPLFLSTLWCCQMYYATVCHLSIGPGLLLDSQCFHISECTMYRVQSPHIFMFM